MSRRCDGGERTCEVEGVVKRAKDSIPETKSTCDLDLPRNKQEQVNALLVHVEPANATPSRVSPVRRYHVVATTHHAR